MGVGLGLGVGSAGSDELAAAILQTQVATQQLVATADALKTPAWRVDRIYKMIATGQSNMVGAGGARGDMTILPGVKVWNGTSFVQAQFGVAPVGTDNNHYIHCANAMIRQGLVDEVQIIVVALGGDTIIHWTRPSYPDNSGTSGFDVRWQAIAASVSASGWDRIDGVQWDQGQAESTTLWTLDPSIYDNGTGLHVALQSGTPDPAWTLIHQGSANTADLYLRDLGLPNVQGITQTPPEGCMPLVTRLKALPQWQTWTAFVAIEMGTWYQQASARNDALRQLVGCSDPQVSCIGSYGAFMSADVGDSDHYDGSCMPMLGARYAGEMVSINLGRGKGVFPPRTNVGGLLAPATDMGRVGNSTTPTTILLGTSDLLNGCVIGVINTTVTLPSAALCSGGRIVVHVTSLSGGNSFVTCGQAIDFNGASSTTATLDSVGVYEFAAVDGLWRQVGDPTAAVGFKRGGTITVPTTLTATQCKGVIYQCSAAVTLPASNTVGRGAVRLAADLGVDFTVSIDTAGGSFIMPDGLVVGAPGTFVVPAGSTVEIQPDAASRWRVVAISIDMLGEASGTKKGGILAAGSTLLAYQCQGYSWQCAGAVTLPSPNTVGRGRVRLIADQGSAATVSLAAGSFLLLDGTTSAAALTIPAGSWADFEPDTTARWRLAAWTFDMIGQVGGLKKGGIITTGTTLTAAQCQVGACYQAAGAITLPAANSAARGRTRIRADQGADITLGIVASGGSFTLSDGSTWGGTITVPAGGFVDLEPDAAGRWTIVGGNVLLGQVLGGKVAARTPAIQQVTTSDATQTVAFANAVAGSLIGTAEYAIYAETQDGTGNSGMAAVRIRYARSASGTVRTFEITTTTAFVGDSALAGCAVAGAISGNNLQIKVTGLAGNSIKWTVMERRVEKTAEYA